MEDRRLLRFGALDEEIATGFGRPAVAGRQAPQLRDTAALRRLAKQIKATIIAS